MILDEILQLKKIAKDSLDKCSTELGFTAGVHHFVDLWARDSLFACLGDLQSIDSWKTIETFKKYQREDGLIPYRIRRSSINLSKYFGKPKILKFAKADFRSFQSLYTVYDGGVTYILVASMRLLKNKSLKEYKIIKPSILKSIKYYANRFDGGLIHEGFLCEWADAVMKRGHTAYTNIIYASALKKFLEVLEMFKEVNEVINVRELYIKIKDELYSKLWNGKYFSDYYFKKRHDYLAVHPNMLAVNLGLTNVEETEFIINEIEKYNVLKTGVKSNYPKYPWYLIPIQNYITGTADYHNGIFWLQPWILYIGGLLKTKKTEKAHIEIKKLFEILSKHKIVFENYDKNWKPLKRLFYKTEGPFAWSSGLLLWILSDISIS